MKPTRIRPKKILTKPSIVNALSRNVREKVSKDTGLAGMQDLVIRNLSKVANLNKI